MRDPFTLDADGATLTVRVSPKASRTAATGVVALDDSHSALAIRIAAPPVDGAANDELLRFLKARLRVGRSALTLVAGSSSRVKRVRIAGDPAPIAAALAGLIGTGG